MQLTVIYGTGHYHQHRIDINQLNGGLLKNQLFLCELRPLLHYYQLCLLIGSW